MGVGGALDSAPRCRASALGAPPYSSQEPSWSCWIVLVYKWGSPGPSRLLAGFSTKLWELGSCSGPLPQGGQPPAPPASPCACRCSHTHPSPPPTSRRRPHHEVGSRAPHDHQLHLQLLGHEPHTLAKGCDLEPIAGVGQADHPVE